MNRILCSTGALLGRANGRDYTLLADLEDKLECDGFELMMYDDWYEKADAVSAFLNGMKKPFVTFHVEKGVGDLISRNAEGDTEKAVELFEKNCELAQAIGSEKLVLHLWSGYDSDKDMPHCIEMYARCRDIAQKHEILLTVENVVCNQHDPISNMREVLKSFPDAAFTYDTKMAEFHGQLMDIASDENRPLWERVVHLHINDYKGGVMDWSNLKTLHLGDGQIDFHRFFDFVRRSGYNGDITIESTSFGKTDGIIDINKMNCSLAKARELARPVKEISDENILECVKVIRSSFLTVAVQFGFTQENAPRFTAFATDENRIKWRMYGEHRRMFGYFKDEKMVGYYSLLPNDKKECELSNLCVLPEYRHQGIGEELLLDAFVRARELGCTKMEIGIVEENRVLRKWYEGYGFIHRGTEKFDFFPFTCGYMTKEL